MTTTEQPTLDTLMTPAEPVDITTLPDSAVPAAFDRYHLYSPTHDVTRYAVDPAYNGNYDYRPGLALHQGRRALSARSDTDVPQAPTGTHEADRRRPRRQAGRLGGRARRAGRPHPGTGRHPPGSGRREVPHVPRRRAGCHSRALHTARRALPEDPERAAVRYALDDPMDRHLLPADAERIANEQLDSEAIRAPDVTAWCRRAVAEYIAPPPTRSRPASTGSATRTPLEL